MSITIPPLVITYSSMFPQAWIKNGRSHCALEKNVGAIKVREVVDKFVEVFIHEGKNHVHGICDILIQV